MHQIQPACFEGEVLMFTSDKVAANAKSRLALVALNSLTMRQMELWRKAIATVIGRDPDCEDVMIIGAVLSTGSEKLLRTGLEEPFEDLRAPLPYELLTKCNVASVAATTNIGRETVRRKVNRLISEGVLTKEGGSLRIARGVLQLPVVREVVQKQLAALHKAMEQMARLGIFASA